MSRLISKQKKEITYTLYELKKTQPKAYEEIKDLIIKLSNQKGGKICVND